MKCGGILNAHHLWGKQAHPALRYDVWNGIPVCGGHHRFFVHGGHPVDVSRWMTKACGKKRLDKLELRARAAKSMKTKMDLGAIRVWLTQQLGAQDHDP